MRDFKFAFILLMSIFMLTLTSCAKSDAGGGDASAHVQVDVGAIMERLDRQDEEIRRLEEANRRLEEANRRLREGQNNSGTDTAGTTPVSPPEPITIPEPLTTSFIETVPPYDVVASARNVSTDTPAWVKMGGIDYQNSICYLAHDTMRMFNTQVISSLHNLNGRYTLLSAEVGRIDGKSAQDTTFSFYGDDERLLKTYVIKAQDLPKQISIDVADVRQLKIKVTFSSDTNAAQGCAFVGTIE